MKSFYVFIAILFTIVNIKEVQSKPLKWKATTFSADLQFSANYTDDATVESRVFGSYTGLTLAHVLGPTLKAKTKANIILETGSNNSLFIDEFAPDQGVFLDEANLTWTPFDFLSLVVGANNESSHKSPLLLTSTPFMGARERVQFNFNESYSFFIEMEQSIPSNTTLANRVGSVEEGTPTFFIETVGLDLKGDLIGLSLYVSQFSFNRLSNGVAHRSRFLGNTVTGSGADNASFLYKFQGKNIYFDLAILEDAFFGLNFSGQYLFNDEGPNGRNTGMMGKVEMHFSPIGIYGQFAKNESDSSPAFYNSKALGHNNKESLTFGIFGKFPKDEIEFDVYYSDQKLIEANIYQDDRKIVGFDIKKSIF